MLRLINALFLSLTLGITSISMAVARGQNSDIGTDIVICTGVGITTITVGPDGQPVKKIHLCPDGISLFTVAFSAPDVVVVPNVMVWRLALPADTVILPQEAPSPAARGPPLDV
ncbi:hypothetical protein [Profundibacter sp.]